MAGFELSSQALLTGGVIGYLIGSIPFAYIVTRRATGKDLRKEGTGNIGTANAFDVTGRKSIGMTVLAADLLKGLIPVLVFELLGLREALLVLVPALILGHCYPVWLRFHGGRGLATAAGAALVINPPMVFFWLIVYTLARRVKDHVHFGAILATAASLAAALLTPVSLIRSTTLGFSGLQDLIPQLMLSITVMLLVILSRHIEPFRALLRRESLKAE